MIVIDGIIYSLQSHGGISVYFNEIISRLQERNNISLKLLAYGSRMPKKIKEMGINDFQHTRMLERYRRCVIPAEAKLFHSSYYRLPSNKVPVVTTVHDFTYERFVTGPRKWVHSWQKFAAIRAADAVICVSESTRRDLFDFLPDIQPKRVHVIHNGVSESFFPLECLVTDIKNCRPYVLFVGARSGYKNFYALVQAMAKHKNLDLKCVGGGALLPREAEWVQQHLAGRFTHHLGVTDAELNKFYNHAYCLAYPSSYEGFGIPVLEAMRAGCVVLALNRSSIPEVAGDAALLLNECTVESFAAALAKIENSSFRNELRAKGLQRAQLFSWDNAFDQTFRVYETLLA